MTEFKFEGGAKDELVLDHCKKLNGNAVVFGILGKDYVRRDLFAANNIKVYFQNYNHPEYQQRFKGFRPSMCILDLLFNHGPESYDILMSGNISYDELQQGEYWEQL